MAQRVFWRYKDDDKTIDLIDWFTGIVPSGVYNGFDFNPSANMNLELIHSNSGYKKTLPNYTESGFVGCIMTKQGALIQEDSSIVIAINPNNDANPRIDVIYVQHQYVEVIGGSPAVYVYAEGTPSVSPVAPATPNPNTEVIIGYLYLPGNTTQLDAVGVSFTKTKKPNFAWTPNTYENQNYILNGDTPHEALSKLDGSIKVIDDQYETNTLKTATVANGTEAGRYAKFATVDLESVDDFYSAIVSFNGGPTVDSNLRPLNGIFQLRIRQDSAFGNNPTVDIIYLSGNMGGATIPFIYGKIVSNIGPSQVEFHVRGSAIGNSYSIRFLNQNKSVGSTIEYFENTPFLVVSGTLRTPRGQKLFKKQSVVNWPGALTVGTPYDLLLLTTPNDGKRRSFEFIAEQYENFGANLGYQLFAALEVRYTSNGNPVSEFFAFNYGYWPQNADSLKNLTLTTAYHFIDVDPGTDMYVRIITQAVSASGSVRIRNIREIDRYEYAIS